MFGENDNGKGRSTVETILGKGTRITGDISTNGSLRIEGQVEGKIKADGDLFVGESGSVKNQIDARNVIIAGKVESNVIAQEKLEILPSGNLRGDIKTNVLKIEEGAKFIGSSNILGDSSKPADDDKVENKKKTDKDKKKNKN